MNKDSSGIFENLRLVYLSYGGVASLLKSGYFWVSLLLMLLSAQSALDFSWPERALAIMPSLAGFSVAAFAIFFSVLDTKLQDALKKPAAELDGRSPLLVITSIVVHAVFIQVLATVFAFVALSDPVKFLLGFSSNSTLAVTLFYMSRIFSFFGLFLTIYGLLLVIAAALTIFRVAEIRSRTAQ